MKGRLFLLLVLSGSLVGIIGLRQFFISPWPSVASNLILFAILTAPLTLTLPGALRGGTRSLLLLCLASMFYFIDGVLELFGPSLFYLGVAEVFFALTLCAISALLLRSVRERQSVEGDSSEPGDA
tara:strand:- start:28903 stop:29280 length:378 start_codon:yes stop_codon:yes gene_type:complete